MPFVEGFLDRCHNLIGVPTEGHVARLADPAEVESTHQSGIAGIIGIDDIPGKYAGRRQGHRGTL
jgi:hypothetical protein